MKPTVVNCLVLNTDKAGLNDYMMKRETGVENFRTEYLARVLCDEKGDLLFSREQVAALAKKSGAVMGRLFQMCCPQCR